MGRIGQIHFIVLALALLDFFLYYQWRVSFRGQWMDILLSLAPFITALIILRYRYRRLKLAGKIYLVALFLIHLLLAPLYLLATVPFVQTTRATAKNYEVRDRPGMLDPVGVVLIKKTFLFEKQLSALMSYDWDKVRAGHPIHIVFKGDCVGVQAPREDAGDTVYYFRK